MIRRPRSPTLFPTTPPSRSGAAVGCREALFTLGDKPELRYRVAREELQALVCETTLEYLARAAEAVLVETGLLPHLNPGAMTDRKSTRLNSSHGYISYAVFC